MDFRVSGYRPRSGIQSLFQGVGNTCRVHAASSPTPSDTVKISAVSDEPDAPSGSFAFANAIVYIIYILYV